MPIPNAGPTGSSLLFEEHLLVGVLRVVATAGAFESHGLVLRNRSVQPRAGKRGPGDGEDGHGQPVSPVRSRRPWDMARCCLPPRPVPSRLVTFPPQSCELSFYPLYLPWFYSLFSPMLSGALLGPVTGRAFLTHDPIIVLLINSWLLSMIFSQKLSGCSPVPLERSAHHSAALP